MTWEKIKGQEKAIEILQADIESSRVTHAYIFSGIEGIGKELAAFEFIKALNCENSYANICCESCTTCNKINKKTHPEVNIVAPQDNIISIDQIRDLQKDLILKPLGIKVKCFIIEESEKLTLESSNCFLKSLEEPPDKVVFILIANKKSSLLPTITSRCKEIKFTPLSYNLQKEIFKSWQLEENTINILIDFCEGSPGKAKKYLSYNIQYWFTRVTTWISKLSKTNSEDCYQICQEFTSINNQELTSIILDLFIYYFGLCILKPENNSFSLNNTILKKLIALVQQTKQNISQRINLSLALEVMLLNIMEAKYEQ
ncbi:MAG: hypothetical protein QMD92_01180 [bacterium]|nr:hypothetical protein [bacterium]